MATKRFNLTEIETGNNIGWYVASQAMFTGTIKFVDEKGTVLAKVEKTNRSQSYMVLGNGHFDFYGKSLHIDIEINESDEIRQSIASNSITDSNAGKVGQIYSFCIEDQGDEDYNDFYINVSAWSRKG